MLFYHKNPGFIVKVHKDAPHVGEPYHPDDRPSTFYRFDPVLNAVIGGYSKGPEHSYAKELMERYPLSNE